MLARKTPLKRKTPLRRISVKRHAELPARQECCRLVALRSEGRCEAGLEGCTGRHEHTHEIVPRSAGGSITDPGNCLAVCFCCHTWTHQHPNEARKLGLLSGR